jgi:CubicO group peptidase (beta-lactamase class C family)
MTCMRLSLLLLLLASAAHAQDFAAVDAQVQRGLEENLIPGAALVIVKDGRIVHARGFGRSGPEGRAVQPDTPFVLGSLSKGFTALAVMQLVEQGKVELDAPVQRYLPEFRVADAEASRRLTVRQLLHQSTGLPTLAPRAKGRAPSLADHVAALSGVALVDVPGTRHRYASPNYQVLGLLVERVSGEPFAQYVQRHLFAPLQMRHAATRPEEAPGLAAGHRVWLGVPLAAQLAHEPDRLPTAGLIASAEDLGHYLIALLQEGRYGEARVLSPAGVAELQRPGAPAEGFSYAMGWRVGTTAGVPSLWHGGALPHYRGALVLAPGEGWGVALLTNASTQLADPPRALVAGVLAQLTGRPPPPPARPLRSTYALLAAAALALVGAQVWSLVRLRRWEARAREAHARGRSALRLRLSALSGLLLTLAVAVGVPRWVGLPWWAMFEGAPDLVGALGLALGLGAAVSLARLVRLTFPRPWPRARPPGNPPSAAARG